MGGAVCAVLTYLSKDFNSNKREIWNKTDNMHAFSLKKNNIDLKIKIFKITTK